jgi:hypothetical protein
MTRYVMSSRVFSPWVFSPLALRANGLDFMHGSLSVFVHLNGDIETYPHLAGEIGMRTYLSDKFEDSVSHPHIIGDIMVQTAVAGRVRINP